MNIVLQNRTTRIISLSPNEECIETLTRYCAQKKITAAHLTAIGACGQLKLAWYNLETKTYEDHEYSENLEITGIIGNVSLVEDKPFIHAHGTFGRRDMSVIGGHIRSMTISAACEITFEEMDGRIERTHDEFTGLNLMRCNVPKFT